MELVIGLAKKIRTNWKKSMFCAVAVAWGGSHAKNYIVTQNIMRNYCKKAAYYGNQTVPATANPRTILVILNPQANKHKAQVEFEKFCAPLLHLAGLNVKLVKTESEGHATELIQTINGADAIVVAGGDGTLSEVITGLLRRTNENASGLVPVGVLPLGKNNSVGKSLFPGDTKLEKVRSLADASMAIIEETSKQMNVMKVEIINEKNKKPVYALAGIKWGAYRDAEVKKDSYWYFGGLKNYATYIFNGLRANLSWNCQARLQYSPPCDGCSNCYEKPNSQPKSLWFQSFMKGNDESRKYQQIYNPKCKQVFEKKISTSDLVLLTSNMIPSQIKDEGPPKLKVYIGPENVDYVDFVKQGWRSENGKNRQVKESIEARTIEIKPEGTYKNEPWFSIDNKEYEVRPLRITLLPKILTMYCKKE